MSRLSPDTSAAVGALGAVDRFLSTHGIAALFACVLLALVVWIGGVTLPDLFNAQLQAQTTALQEHVHATAERNTEARQYERDSLRLQAFLCLNTAREEATRRACQALMPRDAGAR